jgi:hypothetical protein
MPLATTTQIENAVTGKRFHYRRGPAIPALAIVVGRHERPIATLCEFLQPIGVFYALLQLMLLVLSRGQEE